MATIFCALLLFAALIPGIPYGYFTLLRWVVAGTCVYRFLLSTEQNQKGWMWFFAITAVLFNPIVPFQLNRDTWQFIDLVAGVCLLISQSAVIRQTSTNPTPAVAGRQTPQPPQSQEDSAPPSPPEPPMLQTSTGSPLYHDATFRPYSTAKELDEVMDRMPPGPYKNEWNRLKENWQEGDRILTFYSPHSDDGGHHYTGIAVVRKGIVIGEIDGMNHRYFWKDNDYIP